MIPLTDEQMEVASCVYKLFYGNKFLIIKGKTLSGSVYLFQRGYAQYLASGGGTGQFEGGTGQQIWDGINLYYWKAYEYINNHPGLEWRVEIVLEADDGYQLLKKEEQLLTKHMSDKKCLNSNVTAYIPKFNAKTGMYGWISTKHVGSFRRFLSS